MKKQENDAERLRARLEVANRENRRLRNAVKGTDQAVAELRQASDMLLMAAVLNCGAQVGAGAYELTLRNVGADLLKEWALDLQIDEPGGDYRFRLTSRKK